MAAFYGASIFALGCKGGAGGSGAASAANVAAKINNVVNTANNIANAANTAMNVASQAANMTKGAAASSAAADSGQAVMQPSSPKTDADTATQQPAGASPPSPATPGGTATSTDTFVGTWICLAAVDIAPSTGQPVHFQGTGPWIVVNNGDGTISMIDPKSRDQCPPAKWSVSGSTAKAITTEPCSKPDGTVVRTVHGDATLSAKSLTANGLAAVSGSTLVQVAYSLHCTR
jgi:hypothetical protein